jgi:hypothetical protein
LKGKKMENQRAIDLDLDKLKDAITAQPPAFINRVAQPIDFAQRRHREAGAPHPLSPEVASRDNHLRSAEAIERDAEVLRQHGLDLSKRIDEGLAAAERAMVEALQKAEQRCGETRTTLQAAITAHNGAVAEYLTLCAKEADGFRATADEMQGYIKKADARLAAKREAILRAGEEQAETKDPGK